jgi:hypothetical protein
LPTGDDLSLADREAAVVGRGQARANPLTCAVPIIRSQIAFARGRLRRADQDPDALRSEHGIERAGELARAVVLAENLIRAG